MREGRSQAEWDTTSAMIANIRLAAGSKKEDPRDYHPLYVEQKRDAKKQAFRKFVRQQIERQNRESINVSATG